MSLKESTLVKIANSRDELGDEGCDEGGYDDVDEGGD